MPLTVQDPSPVDFPQPLDVTARRRALCELADLYAVEQTSAQRPLTAVLPALIHPLRAWFVPLDDAVGLFDAISRERAVLGKADSTYEQMDHAERRAEFLLDQLLGEAAL